jgi:hypothetical protein
VPQPPQQEQEAQYQDQARDQGEQQAELHHPQATRKAQPSKSQPQDNLFLHAPQTSAPSHGPPSPLVVSSNPTEQLSIAPPQQPPSPSGTQRSAPSPIMPPPPGPQRTIRQIDGKGMQTSSRESSLVGHHPQGPASSLGIPSYPANGVPPGSQGQLYRGQGQDAEQGRATPPLRSVADMTDEDAAHYQQLMKDHKELSRLPSFPIFNRGLT